MKYSLFLLVFLLNLNNSAAMNLSPVRISVSRFDQQVSHIYEGCRGWTWSRQDQLQQELERSLSQRGLRVLERRSIRDIYETEQRMPGLDRRSKPERNKLISAQYTVTGGVTELGVCEDATESGIQLGGIVEVIGGPSSDLSFKSKKVKSKVKLTANLVSVQTGEVLRSFSAYSEITDSETGVRAEVAGIGTKHGTRTRPPIERASNQALEDLSKQLHDYLLSLSST